MVDVDAAPRQGRGNQRSSTRVRAPLGRASPAPRVSRSCSAADDARLVQESLAAGELLPAGEGRYYSRSYCKDTARSEERTIVATSNPADKGVYNNWRPSSEMKPLLEDRMRGASAGKTMYVVPYLMAPPGSPLESYAAGVQLTDHRTVVLHMIRMARVGAELRRRTSPTPPASCAPSTSPATWRTWVRARPTTSATSSPLPTSARSCTSARPTAATRCWARSPTACARRAYDGWASRQFLAEQFMLIGIRDKQTGRTYHICGGFPSASGKTNLAMMVAARRPRGPLPRRVLRRRHRLAVGRRDDGRIYGDEPRERRLRRRQGHQREHQPDRHRLDRRRAAARSSPTSPTTTTPTRSGGRAARPQPRPTSRLARLERRAHRRPRARAKAAEPRGRTPTAGSPPRWPTYPTSPPDADDPKGVPIDAIIFGGRTSDREPLVRAITDLAEGVYDGLTLGAEATFAADGKEGMLRYDPMSMRPFMSYPRGRLRRALAQGRGRGRRTCRSSRTSTGSSATPRTATSSGPATARTFGRCSGCCS